MSMIYMRPVTLDDFDQVMALAKQTGGGMTNLPPEPEALRERIGFAANCFEKGPTGPNGETYMLVMVADGQVIGTSAVFSAIGLEHGFINYRISKSVHFSTQLKKRIERRILVPTHDFSGCAEVGSLFLSPSARGGGLGKFLARARYLFIAMHRTLIADTVCAEMRGWRNEAGDQPFWQSLGKRFFDMEFEAADITNAAMGNQFIADLMPRHPIYVALLSKAARDSIGRPHDGGVPAYNMLLKEGFAFHDYVDVFDAGPLVDAKIDEIKSVKDSQVVQLEAIKEPGADDPQFLIASGYLETFRVVRCAAKLDEARVCIDAAAAQALQVQPGDDLRLVAW